MISLRKNRHPMTTKGDKPQELKPSDFQSMADAIRSGQVPDADVIAIMRENPEFERWYRERYRLDKPPV
jgi:hypothetical protein